MNTCTHLNQIQEVTANTNGCEESPVCLVATQDSIHLSKDILHIFIYADRARSHWG
jgi:hypothetical protein